MTLNYKEKIEQFCENKFLKEGFFKITMDEIASEMLISKKTIYKYYPSKKDLVQSVTENFVKKLHSEAIDFLKSDCSTVEKIENITSFIASNLIMVSEKFFFDLERVYPDLWQLLENQRFVILNEIFGTIIENGKAQKVIEDKPNSLLVEFVISTIRGIVNPNFIMFNSLSIQEAVESTIILLMKSLLTNEGYSQFLELKERKK